MAGLVNRGLGIKFGGFKRADFARFSCVHTSSADEAEYKLASINRREVFDSCKQYRAYISNSTT